MASERDDTLTQALSAMRNALVTIANYGDCDYALEGDDKPSPCPCPQCTAKLALETATEWRIQGAMHHRVGSMPIEAALVASMRKHFFLNQSAAQADRKLSLVLDEAEQGINGDFRAPSVRDWYVAASVIQWLGTNVGSCLLGDAGFRRQPGTVFQLTELAVIHEALRSVLFPQPEDGVFWGQEHQIRDGRLVLKRVEQTLRAANRENGKQED